MKFEENKPYSEGQPQQPIQPRKFNASSAPAEFVQASRSSEPAGPDEATTLLHHTELNLYLPQNYYENLGRCLEAIPTELRKIPVVWRGVPHELTTIDIDLASIFGVPDEYGNYTNKLPFKLSIMTESTRDVDGVNYSGSKLEISPEDLPSYLTHQNMMMVNLTEELMIAETRGPFSLMVPIIPAGEHDQYGFFDSLLGDSDLVKLVLSKTLPPHMTVNASYGIPTTTFQIMDYRKKDRLTHYSDRFEPLISREWEVPIEMDVMDGWDEEPLFRRGIPNKKEIFGTTSEA
jgi:hypothetical protein